MAKRKRKRSRPEPKRPPVKKSWTSRSPRRARSTPSLEAHGPSDAWRGYYRRPRTPGCGLLPDPPPIGTHVIGPDDYDDDDY